MASGGGATQLQTLSLPVLQRVLQHSYVANSFSVVGTCPVHITPKTAKFPYSVLAVQFSWGTVKQLLQCVQYAWPLVD